MSLYDILAGGDNIQAVEVDRRHNTYTYNGKTVRYSFNINGTPAVSKCQRKVNKDSVFNIRYIL